MSAYGRQLEQRVVAEIPLTLRGPAAWSTSMLMGAAVSLPAAASLYHWITDEPLSPLDLFAQLLFGAAETHPLLYLFRLLLGYVAIVIVPSVAVQGLRALLLRRFGGKPHFDLGRGRVWSEGRFRRNDYLASLVLSILLPIGAVIGLMYLWEQPWLAVAFSMVVGLALQPLTIIARLVRFNSSVQVETGWEGLRIFGRPGDAPVPTAPLSVVMDAAMGVLFGICASLLLTELIYLVLLVMVSASARQHTPRRISLLVFVASSQPRMVQKTFIDTDGRPVFQEVQEGFEPVVDVPERTAFTSLVLMLSCGGGAFSAVVGLRKRWAATYREEKEELAAAYELHKNLVPLEPPSIPGLDIAAHWQSATDFGGDFYTYLQPSDWELGLALGDVSGHGLQAAMNSALALGVLDCESTRCLDPGQLLTNMNSVIMRRIHSQSWVALSLAMINLRSGFMRYGNAGQPYAMVKRGRRVEVIRRGGLPLGRVASARYQESLVRLQPGSFVLFATDGVLGAASPLGGFFGRDRLQRLMEDYDPEGSAQGLVDLIVMDLGAFAGKMDHHDDDVTMLVMHVLPSEHPPEPS